MHVVHRDRHPSALAEVDERPKKKNVRPKRGVLARARPLLSLAEQERGAHLRDAREEPSPLRLAQGLRTIGSKSWRTTP